MQKIYGIDMGFEYTQYSSIKSAEEHNPIFIVVILKTGEHKSHSGNIYDLCKVSFLSNKEGKSNLEYNGWKNTSISEPYFTWQSKIGGVNSYSISDPK